MYTNGMTTKFYVDPKTRLIYNKLYMKILTESIGNTITSLNSESPKNVMYRAFCHVVTID